MRWLTSFAVVVAFAAQAEDEAQRRAREELEKQLNQMVEKVPARVRVEFQPIDDPNFQVEELELSVDGKPLKAPAASAISGWIQDGAMPVGVVEVSPGRHKVSARVTVHNTASPMVTDEGDHRWKVAGDVGFEVAAGIEVKVIVAPVRDPGQRDVGKRLKLTFPSQPVMIARLEDGTMPEPIKPKPVAVAAPVDAGPTKEQLAAEALAAKKAAEAQEAVRKAEDAKLAKQQAADEKQRKAEEAKLAKQQAADEKKRRAEEARLAKQQAAEEKKRKAEEAKLAKLQAAEEKKRQAEEARLAKLKPPVAAAVPEVPVDQQQAQAASDAGAEVVAAAPDPIDAGPPEVVLAVPEPVVPEPVDAGVAVAAAASAEESSGPPWAVIGAGVGALALVVIALLVRRAGRVPDLKD